MSEALILAKALFPDAVDFQYIDTREVQEGTFEYEIDDGIAPGDFILIEHEDITLQPIAKGIYAGMSQKTHRVFIFLDPAIHPALDDGEEDPG